MDTEKQFTRLTTASSTATPAYLLVGSPETSLQETKLFLQKKLCAKDACQQCNTCVQIENEQHHALMWINTDKQYTLEQLAPIFETISFTLNQDERYFFIIQKADFLSSLCANRLLKSLEEPPAGYCFILLAQTIDAILPTIRSRCIIERVAYQSIETKHQQLAACLTQCPIDPTSFLQALEETTINERESSELINTLLAFWIEKTKKSINCLDKKDQSKNEKIVALLAQSLLHLPMPGSSKLFWRNIFLKIQAVELAHN